MGVGDIDAFVETVSVITVVSRSADTDFGKEADILFLSILLRTMALARTIRLSAILLCGVDADKQHQCLNEVA